VARETNHEPQPAGSTRPRPRPRAFPKPSATRGKSPGNPGSAGGPPRGEYIYVGFPGVTLWRVFGGVVLCAALVCCCVTNRACEGGSPTGGRESWDRGLCASPTFHHRVDDRWPWLV